MELTTIWFILIGLLWTGFLVLEGFDFGVGMLGAILGRESAGLDAADAEKRRRVLYTTIGPFWDGNEVWLLTAGGATFAAFPHWYATMFSGMYLALLLVLVALIVRNMGFEYRGKRDSMTWKRGWDRCIHLGSLLPPLLIGTALTNLVHGLPIDKNMEFTGNLFTLLNPVSLLGGITLTALCLTHGSHFVALKTTGPLRDEARGIATKAGLVTAVLAVILLVWLGVESGKPASWVTTVLAAVSLLAAIYCNTKGAEGKAFVGTSATIVLVVVTYFVMLFPNVMPTTLADGTSLTTTNAASTELTLKIMTGAALVFTPVALAYTAWNYWVFRRRIGTQHIPEAHSAV